MTTRALFGVPPAEVGFFQWPIGGQSHALFAAEIVVAPPSAPTLVATTPSGDITRQTPLVYTAADDIAITSLWVGIRYEGDAGFTTIYDGKKLHGDFKDGSVITGALGGTSIVMSFKPNGGWRRKIAELSFDVNDGNFAV